MHSVKGVFPRKHVGFFRSTSILNPTWGKRMEDGMPYQYYTPLSCFVVQKNVFIYSGKDFEMLAAIPSEETNFSVKSFSETSSENVNLAV